MDPIKVFQFGVGQLTIAPIACKAELLQTHHEAKILHILLHLAQDDIGVRIVVSDFWNRHRD